VSPIRKYSAVNKPSQGFVFFVEKFFENFLENFYSVNQGLIVINCTILQNNLNIQNIYTKIRYIKLNELQFVENDCLVFIKQ
jgi:hypothetical protein